MNPKSQLLDEIVSKFKDHLDSAAMENKKPFVIKYIHKGEFYGYHLSSMCQVGQNINEAKRYSGNVERQIKVIEKNLKFTLKSKDAIDFPGTMGKVVYNKHWLGVEIEDVFIDFEYLEENTKPHTFKVDIIE